MITRIGEEADGTRILCGFGGREMGMGSLAFRKTITTQPNDRLHVSSPSLDPGPRSQIKNREPRTAWR